MRESLASLAFVALLTFLGVACTSASPTPSNLQATIDALRTEFTTPTPTTATPSLNLQATVDARVAKALEAAPTPDTQATVDAAVAKALSPQPTAVLDSGTSNDETGNPSANATPTLRATPTPVTCVDERYDTVPLAWISQDLVATEETLGIGAYGFPQAWHSFAMEATFNNPYGISTKEGNFGFVFHACGSTSDAVVLTSVGKWSHTLIDGISDPGLNFETIDEGTFAASLLDTHAYGAQTLRLTVKDNTGIFYANGTRIADIRVSSSPRGSALGVVTCIFDNQCTRPEATTRVTDFKASPL